MTIAGGNLRIGCTIPQVGTCKLQGGSGNSPPVHRDSLVAVNRATRRSRNQRSRARKPPVVAHESCRDSRRETPCRGGSCQGCDSAGSMVAGRDSTLALKPHVDLDAGQRTDTGRTSGPGSMRHDCPSDLYAGECTRHQRASDGDIAATRQTRFPAPHPLDDGRRIDVDRRVPRSSLRSRASRMEGGSAPGTSSTGSERSSRRRTASSSHPLRKLRGGGEALRNGSQEGNGRPERGHLPVARPTRLN